MGNDVYPSEKRGFAFPSHYVYVNLNRWLAFRPLPLMAIPIVLLLWASRSALPRSVAAPDSPFLLVEEPADVDFRLNR
jgi:hypothetical protein